MKILKKISFLCLTSFILLFSSGFMSNYIYAQSVWDAPGSWGPMYETYTIDSNGNKTLFFNWYCVPDWDASLYICFPGDLKQEVQGYTTDPVFGDTMRRG